MIWVHFLTFNNNNLFSILCSLPLCCYYWGFCCCFIIFAYLSFIFFDTFCFLLLCLCIFVWDGKAFVPCVEFWFLVWPLFSCFVSSSFNAFDDRKGSMNRHTACSRLSVRIIQSKFVVSLALRLLVAIVQRELLVTLSMSALNLLLLYLCNYILECVCARCVSESVNV